MGNIDQHLKSKRARAGHRHFLHLYSKHQGLIYAYIVFFIPHLQDADDLFQEVSLRMWDKFDSYQPGTDFLAWGRTIAHHQVIDWFKKQQRRRLCYSTYTVQLLSDYASRNHVKQDRRVQALKGCLRQLSDEDRCLVKSRYACKTTTKALAQRLDRSVDGLYKTFARIHTSLYRCIKKKLITESL